MGKKKQAELVVIYYDTTDPQNQGWAYNVRTFDGDNSGPLTSRRTDAKLPTLYRQLRGECSGVALPPLTSFRETGGWPPAWEARQ